MPRDDDFEPELGRLRARGKGVRPRKFLHRVLAAASLARGGAAVPARRNGFIGSRIGRGAGAGRVLAARDRYAAFRARRVIVKARLVRLGGKGLDAAKAHLRYIERDGTSRSGERGALYDAASDRVERRDWMAAAEKDRHQFRFIVSAEDGADYDELKPLTRRLMARMEEDLGTALDWVAVDHYDTGHPHTHIVVRGKDNSGEDLVIARDYIAHGLRERACELVDLDLGPRTEDQIITRLRAEVEQERLTSIDRTLLREAETHILVDGAAERPIDAAIRTGRLRMLARLGLAREVGTARWQLAPDMESTLRTMGERGDIIRTMQRALSEAGHIPPIADQAIYDPAASAATPLVGRIVRRGLADELTDRHYLIVDATDGRTHYVDIGASDGADSSAEGAIVRITPAAAGVRAADGTIAAVAEANGGSYSIAAHLAYDPGASEAFAEAHVRRLEAMRRATGSPAREVDGSWVVGPDHLVRAAAYEAAQVKARPVAVDMLSPASLEKLVDAHAATWLDRELTAASPEPLRASGFGVEVGSALARRRQWLVAEGLASNIGGDFAPRADIVAVLERRELARVAATLARELGLPFAEADGEARITGLYRKRIDALSGRYALIERTHDFTLVPWRPLLERHIGKPVAGLQRGGTISWTLGRQRSGPSIS